MREVTIKSRRRVSSVLDSCLVRIRDKNGGCEVREVGFWIKRFKTRMKTQKLDTVFF